MIKEYYIEYKDRIQSVEGVIGKRVRELRDSACKCFGIEIPRFFNLLYNGEEMDLLDVLEEETVDSHRVLHLMYIIKNCDAKSVRVSIDYEDEHVSRFYSPTSKLSQLMMDFVNFQGIETSSTQRLFLRYKNSLIGGMDLESSLADYSVFEGLYHFVFVIATTIATADPLKPVDREGTPPIDMASLVSTLECGCDARYDRIQQEMQAMKNDVDSTQYSSCLSMLMLIIKNILTEPDNLAKRTINYRSSGFQSKVGAIPAGRKIMILLGNYDSSMRFLGFSPIQTEKGDRLFLQSELLLPDLLESCYKLFQNSLPQQESAQLLSPSFNAYQPVIVSSIPSSTHVVETLEKQVEAIKQKQTEVESVVPERELCVFRSGKGFNPRNFGENVHDRMTATSDHNESPEEEDEKSDMAIIREVQARKAKEKERNEMLMTKSKRMLDTLKTEKVYRRAMLRVHFPDSTILQAYFAPGERISDVEGVVRSAFLPSLKSIAFYLFTSPPKRILPSDASLKSLKLVPAAMVYLAWSEDGPTKDLVTYIIPEVIIDTPYHTQIDRGSSIGNEDETKKEKKKNFLKKLLGKPFCVC